MTRVTRTVIVRSVKLPRKVFRLQLKTIAFYIIIYLSIPLKAMRYADAV